MSDQTPVRKPRELAHRTSDGIEVTLLWTKIGDRLSVLVDDWRSGEHFELEPARERALEVYYHPYAYAGA